MANKLLTAQLQTFYLYPPGVSIGSSSMTLNSFQSIDGVDLTMADFGGVIGYGTVQPNSSDREEQISFTGVTQNVNGTATLTGIKNVGFLYPHTQTSNFAKSHPGGVKFIISNTSGYEFTNANQFNDATIHETWTFNALSEDANPKIDDVSYVPVAEDYITKGYIDDNVALTVKEVDGNPTVTNVKVIRFQNGTVTNDGGGQVTILNSGGGGGAGGFSSKPMTFALTDNDSSGSEPLTGYVDREALCYKNTTDLIFQDEAGFMQARDVTTDWASADNIASFVLINTDLYVLLQDSIGTTARVYVYNAADLSLGGTLVTLSGQTLAYKAGQTMTSNGTHIFFTFDSGQSANAYVIAKFSHASNTMTYISSVTCGSTANQFNVAFAVDDSEDYYGFDSGVAYQYDSAGALQYTSGDAAYTTSAIINWTNTLYTNDDSDNIFVKLYLPNTEIDTTSGMIIRLAAEENLTEGDTVGYATNIDDAAVKAVWAQRLTNAAIGENISAVQAICRLTGDVYALLVTNGVQYKATIATLDRDTMTWSFGALSANIASEVGGNADIVKLDTNKFAVASFNSITNPYTIRVRACSVSGTTITVGTAVTFSEPSTDNADNVMCVQLGTDRFAMVVGGTQASSHCDLFEVTVSGTVPTIGSQEIIDASTTNISGIAVIGTDKVAVINDKSLWIATVSAGVWTVGSPATLAGDTGSDTQILGIISNATDTVFVNTNGFLEYFTVSGTTITAVATGTYTTTGGTATTLATDSSNVYLINQSTTDSVNGAAKLTVSGAAITLSPFAQFDIANAGAARSMFATQVLDGADYFGITQGNNNPAGSNIEFLFHVQGMTQYFMGIAQTTVTRGNTVNVLISGVDTHQTGLTAGALYDPFEGGLVAVATPGVFTLQAQNATSIKI